MPSAPTVTNVFFDDAGNTGEDLDHPSQTNYFLAAVAIPEEDSGEFWKRARPAWEIASRCLKMSPADIELKGSDIYGGKERFRNLAWSTRWEILDAVFTALTDLMVRAYWIGTPKHLWQSHRSLNNQTAKEFPFEQLNLYGFCLFLSELLSTRYPDQRFRFCGDENSLVKAGKQLVNPNLKIWRKLSGGGIGFYQSSKVPGIQVADLLVHTLYRSNKANVPRPDTEPPQLSNTDRLAAEFRDRLAKNDLLVNIPDAYRMIKSDSFTE